MYRFKASECPYFEFYGVLIEFVCDSAKKRKQRAIREQNG